MIAKGSRKGFGPLLLSTKVAWMRLTGGLEVLRKRAEFLAVAAAGKKWVTPGVIVQIRPRPEEGCPSRRLGLTASKRVGNAVHRNRARRRLRALATEVLAAHAVHGCDYVLIARPSSIDRPYAQLREDLIWALKRLKVWRP